MTEAFHSRLRLARLQGKMSYRALAEKASLSATYICELEKSKKNPTIDVVNRLADSLDVQVDWLIGKNERLQTANAATVTKEMVPASCRLMLPASLVADVINEAILAGVVCRVKTKRNNSASGS